MKVENIFTGIPQEKYFLSTPKFLLKKKFDCSDSWGVGLCAEEDWLVDTLLYKRHV